MHYRATVEYDGTAYYGFQRQADHMTIQEQLERVLSLIGQGAIRVIGAGRTDTGVHASGQVIAFDLEWGHGPSRLQRAMNANLPADIAVLAVEETVATFHPRYDARRRAYEYRMDNGPVRRPLRRATSWHVRQPLDVAKMDKAARSLLGVHDFATFGQPTQGDSTIREVFAASCRRDGELVTFQIEANAFLYRMARAITGSLKLVGEGRWSVEQFEAALRARDRDRAGATAPAHGLCLVSVTY